MPHGGGTVPFLLYRMSAMDDRPNAAERLPGGSVAGTLRRLYFDVAEVCSPGPLKCLMEAADPAHIVFGTDFPFSRHRSPAQDVRSVVAAFDAFDGWNETVRHGVESGNALQLFPRLAQRMARAS